MYEFTGKINNFLCRKVAQCLKKVSLQEKKQYYEM